MANKLIKKIWFIWLWLVSLALVGCFHIPDEDWLPSKDKVNTWDTQKDNEMDQALNDIMEWINMISSDWNSLKSNENDEFSTEDWSENIIEVEDNAINDEETVDNTETTDNEVENEEVEEDITPEE